jgi:hypothetical protein
MAANGVSSSTFAVNYEGSGTPGAVSQTFTGDGGFTIILGGNLFQQKTVNADGSYNIHHYTAGKYRGAIYASYNEAYTAANVLAAVTYYDGSGNVIARQVFAHTGDHAAASGGDQSAVGVASSGDPAGSLISEPQIADAAAIADASAQQTAHGANLTNALVVGADYVRAPSGIELNTVMGPAPKRDTLARALLVGGVVLPAIMGGFTARSGLKQSRQSERASLTTFDLLADRFEPAESEVMPSDLPSVMHSGDETGDWEIFS